MLGFAGEEIERQPCLPVRLTFLPRCYEFTDRCNATQEIKPTSGSDTDTSASVGDLVECPVPVSISSLVPNADDLLALDVEEVAGVLLTHLNSCGSNSGDSVVQNNLISQHNFLQNLQINSVYPGRQPEVNQALMEAWNWLQGESLLIRHAGQQAEWFFVLRRGHSLKSRVDFAAYRNASLLPKGRLHPLIASKVYPAFLRGEYDTAVFQAFREIEVAVRRAGEYPNEMIGTKLMRSAFRPDTQKSDVSPGRSLSDSTLPAAEQEAMSNLFAGAIGLYKNPQSHRNVPTEAIDAAEVIVFASHLLRMVDRRDPSAA